jgi:hypothetical protein
MIMRVTRKTTTRSRSVGLHLLAALVSAVMFLSSGCDDEESSTEQVAEERLVELSRQLEAERRSHARDLNQVQTEQMLAQDDFDAVALTLIGAAMAIVILILLLARERRA